jgi:hypothetical protein
MKIEAVIYLNTDMFVEAKGLNVATMWFIIILFSIRASQPVVGITKHNVFAVQRLNVLFCIIIIIIIIQKCKSPCIMWSSKLLALGKESFANSTVHSCYIFIAFISSAEHHDIGCIASVSYSIHPDFDS